MVRKEMATQTLFDLDHEDDKAPAAQPSGEKTEKTKTTGDTAWLVQAWHPHVFLVSVTVVITWITTASKLIGSFPRRTRTESIPSYRWLLKQSDSR